MVTVAMAMVALATVALAMVSVAMVQPPFTVSITELVYLPTSTVPLYRTTIHHRLLLQVQKIPRHLLSGFLLLSQAMSRLCPMAMLVHTAIQDMLAFMGILAMLKLAMLILAMPTLEHTQYTLAGHMLLLQLLLLLLPSLSEA